MSDSHPEILVAGSGPGALEATLALTGSEYLDAHISLISPQLEFEYRPNVVLEPFGVATPAKYLVADIIEHPNVTQWKGTLDRVDPAACKAHSPEGDEFDYDVLIVATGAELHCDLPEPVITFGAPGSLSHLSEIVQEIDHGNVRDVLFVVPPGHVWPLPSYEFALICADRAERQGGQQIGVVIVTPEQAPLEVFGPENSALVAKLCAQVGVTVHTNCSVSSYDGATARLNDGTLYPVDRVFAMPRLSGHAPPGVPCDRDGFVPVDQYQLAIGTENIYAVGDVAYFRVKQGGIASKQADAAVTAIEATLGTRPEARPFSREVESLLLTADHRVALKAHVGESSSESIAIDQPTGPVQKIHSQLLAERLHAISPI